MNPLNQALSARRPPMGLVPVVGLHALFIYALIAGLGFHRPATQEQPLEGRIIPEPLQAPVERPFAPSDPRQVLHFPMETPIPLPPIDDAVTSVDASVDLPVDSGPGTAEVAPAFVAARVDPRRPLTQPPYPPGAIRSGHEGTLTLELRVRTDGKVIDARVMKSSGFPMLDEAAVNEAKRRWKLLPATRGGVAVEDWTRLSVVFRLDQR